jgi:hypothetical protein
MAGLLEFLEGETARDLNYLSLDHTATTVVDMDRFVLGVSRQSSPLLPKLQTLSLTSINPDEGQTVLADIPKLLSSNRLQSLSVTIHENYTDGDEATMIAPIIAQLRECRDSGSEIRFSFDGRSL